nr:reverse transcriptase domain-containing protein [Tanacetum cinerariifolium]
PVRQKKRGQAPERTKAIQAEVEKLVEAEVMREVYYHDWLSNPVMVKKHDGSWRMCVDFTDLNKACPQDCYPLPEIDWKTLRKINMKLNPRKCSFGLAEGVFLGYVITPEGIKPCPDKTTAVLQLPLPQTIKEVQSLNGKLASLNSPSDRTGDDTDAGILHKPCVTGSGTKLLINGKAGTITGLCSKKASKIFSSTSYRGPRSVVAKAIRLGYFWPTMHKDAQDMIRKCSDCQIHRHVTRHPQQPLTPITAPWPFYKWGINIAGPFPEGPGRVKFLIVAMDYFTKWIEAKAVATITGGQFADNAFKDWCDKLNITQHFASVKHPQSNGLVERANRSLEEGIKARLGEGNKNWVEELPPLIPAEIGMPTYRTTVVDVVNNDEELRLNLDLLEERRELAAI